MLHRQMRRRNHRTHLRFLRTSLRILIFIAFPSLGEGVDEGTFDGRSAR